jgi:hypothetical protein
MSSRVRAPRPDPGHGRGREREERKGSVARRLASELALEPDREAEQRGERSAAEQRELERRVHADSLFGNIACACGPYP